MAETLCCQQRSSSQGYGFSSGHVWMWELDYKESWAQKNWCFWTVVLEKTLKSPLNCKEIKPAHPKGDQSWVSLEGLILKLKLQSFGLLMQRADSFEKTISWERLRAGGEGDARGWDGSKASPTQGTWVGWTLGFGDRQGSLVCWGSWGRKESVMTEWLNWLIELGVLFIISQE